MKNWIIWLVLTVVVIGALVWFISSNRDSYTEVASFSEDTTIDEDYAVAEGERVTLKDGATLTVNGNLTVNGAFVCENGPLNVIVTGDAVLEDSLICERSDELPDGDEAFGISFVTQGSLTISEQATISSNGHIQIVGDTADLATTKEALERLYDETVRDTGNGQRIGPFIDEVSAASLPQKKRVVRQTQTGKWLLQRFVTPQAHAQGAAPVIIRGKIVVKTPPKGVKQIVVFNFPTASGVSITNFELSGPDGRKGADDKSGNCNARGDDGENAFRFNAFAPNITVNNFTLNLGSGGDGGDAETSKDCDPGTARSGDGGKSGNFKMVAGREFKITGAFAINPGSGGNAGGATAHGKDGGPSEDGGDATATGGKGADNKKKLSIVGSVAGTNNVQVGDILGGSGGFASANPGTGGDGVGCSKKGGDGGSATATGGDGGDASLTLAGGAARSPLAKNIAGSGATADATGAKAGNGGNCDPTGPGGNGGKGGDAVAKEGTGGKDDSGGGADGIVIDETGGNGGNGGDGCDEGSLGRGGNGDPQGNNGKDGKNICQLPPQTQSGVSVPETQTIRVIQFMDYYIPIDQLIVVPAHTPFCDEDHWHPAEGHVINTMGFPMNDPNSNGCGFGTLSERSVMEIPDPAQ